MESVKMWLLGQAGFRKLQIKSSSSILGNLDYAFKPVFQMTRRHGKLMEYFIAKALCLVLGYYRGLGAELRVPAHKALPS